MLRCLAPWIPYVAVLVGMYAMGSAWAAVGGYYAGMAVVIGAAGGWRWRRLVAGYALGRTVLAIAVGVGAGAGLYVCWPLFGLPTDFGSRLASLGLTPAAWPWFLAFFPPANAWLEEVFWRGCLGSPARGLTWNDLLFAGYHLLVLAPFMRWPWLVVVMASLTFAGWFWRQRVRRDGGLFFPVASHLAADTSIMLLTYVLVA